MDAVIFDMDGVLIDSEPIYMHHVLEFYRRFDIHVPYKEVVKLAGSSHEAGLEMMSAWWKEDITPSEFEKFYEANSDEEIVYSEILNPYVLYVLKRLKARGMKLAIASSSPKQAIVTMVNEDVYKRQVLYELPVQTGFFQGWNQEQLVRQPYLQQSSCRDIQQTGAHI